MRSRNGAEEGLESPPMDSLWGDVRGEALEKSIDIPQSRDMTLLPILHQEN
jgi:hypothetical protein